MVPIFQPGDKLTANMRVGNNPNKSRCVFVVEEKLPDNIHFHVYKVRVFGLGQHLMSVDKMTGQPALHV